jgi:hypothetical protein
MKYLFVLMLLCASCQRGPLDCDNVVHGLYPGRKVEVLDASEVLIYVIDGKFAVECTYGVDVIVERVSWSPWKKHWCSQLYHSSQEYQTQCVPPKTPEKAP